FAFRSQMEGSKVRLKNAQIVNGCQTVHSLWHVYKSGDLQPGVEVLVRIIEQSDPEFGQLVTRYNNSQNAVRTSDLVGRDVIQIQLQKDIEAFGYYYETRRGDWKQYFADRDERIKKFGKNHAARIIRVKEAAQACAAFFLQQPVLAKSKTTLLTTPASEGGAYEDVFNADSSAPRIIGAVELMRRITTKRREILETGKPTTLAKHSDWLPHADFFILALFGRQYFDGENVQTKEKASRFFEELNKQFDSLYSAVVKDIGNFISKRHKELGYNYPKFFKSETGWQATKNAMDRPSPLQIP
ncbi:MAG TPA: AIPR family protein, partial [Pyrinomonadaceae bacterium]|nr:AIPR family protein [Pyrinomonadaceae bacterium]